LQKQLRLNRREDFSKVYKFGKSVANHQLVLYVLPNKEANPFRVGISASKKIGNAVVRNHMRRLLKEIMRLHEAEIAEHFDLVFIVRKPAVSMEYAQLEKSVFHLLRKASLLKR